MSLLFHQGRNKFVSFLLFFVRRLKFCSLLESEFAVRFVGSIACLCFSCNIGLVHLFIHPFLKAKRAGVVERAAISRKLRHFKIYRENKWLAINTILWSMEPQVGTVLNNFEH